jgi:hypothetical protein
MNRYQIFGRAAFCWVVIACCAAAQPSLDEIERVIESRWRGLSAFQATMLMRGEGRDKGVRMSSELKGPLIVERLDDGSVRYRAEVSGQAKIGPFGLIRVDMYTLSVSDGAVLYKDTHMAGRRSVTKAAADAGDESVPGGGGRLVRQAREGHSLTYVGEGEYEGRKTFIIEGTPLPGKHPKGSKLARVEWFFDQETGIQLRTAGYDARGTLLSELLVTGIEFNPTIDPVIFRYAPPEGVKVTEERNDSSVEK